MKMHNQLELKKYKFRERKRRNYVRKTENKRRVKDKEREGEERDDGKFTERKIPTKTIMYYQLEHGRLELKTENHPVSLSSYSIKFDITKFIRLVPLFQKRYVDTY